MTASRFLVTSAMLALLTVPAFAQGTQPAQPAKPAPVVTSAGEARLPPGPQPLRWLPRST